MGKFDHIHTIDVNSLKPLVKEAKKAENAICHTIEELLSLNELLTKRKNKAIVELQEGQLDKEKNRGEIEVLTEKQFEGKKDKKNMIGHELEPHKNNGESIEVALNNPKNKTRNEKAWDLDDVEKRGHKNISPLWISVYNAEDARKKLDKGQLDKKKK